jgi:hypothetical protein
MMGFSISKKLAYETGVHIGDGNLYSKKRTHKITYSGNLLNEEPYYVEILGPLVEEIYHVQPKIYRRNQDNTILIVLNSKSVAEFKISKLRLPNGKKTHIKIPEIIHQDPELLRECIKGIGDTDFSISFKKNRQGKYNEPRIELISRSTELVNQLHESLLSLNFTAAKETRKRRGYIENRLRIYGKRNLKLWMKEIGFLNPYRLKKIEVWEKYGEVLPYQTYHDYISLLKSR